MLHPQKRVAIFGRLKIIQDSLAAEFEAAGFEVVIKADDAKTAIRVIRDGHIDVVVTDVDLKLETAFHVIENVKQKKFPTKYIVYTDEFDSVLVQKAVNCCNVSAYLLQTSAGACDVVDAANRVLAGERVFSSDVERHLTIDETGRRVAHATDPLSRLSLKQFEAFRLLGVGLSIKEVARVLDCSWKSVDSAACKIHSHLGVHNRSELVALAISTGVSAPRLARGSDCN
jgi:DNA-binding NarL/FixJ family response regulator